MEAMLERSAAAKGRFFEDVSEGEKLDNLVKGPLTTAHLMRWSAAMENWHKIHYDKPFAQEHDKLPDLLINGSLKQQFLTQILKDWAGSQGWVWKVRYQFRAMNLVGETLTVWGHVTKLRRLNDFGLAELELGIVNNEGKESTPAGGVVALPYRDGKALPYPFVAPADG